MVSLKFFIDNASGRNMALWLTTSNRNKYQEYFPGGRRPADDLNQFHVPIVLQSEDLNLLEPLEPLQACTGIVLPIALIALTIWRGIVGGSK
jgi:hypothetical protein